MCRRSCRSEVDVGGFRLRAVARGTVASGAGALVIGADAAGALVVEAEAFVPPMFFQLRYPAEEASRTTAATMIRALVLPPLSSSSAS